MKLRVTAHPTEVPERVAEAMRRLTGLDEATFCPLLTQTVVETHHGARQVLLEATVQRQRDITSIWKHLMVFSLDDADRRMDEDGVFYVRFEKQAAYKGEARPGGNDAIQLRIKPEVHPFRREAALAAVVEAWPGPDCR